MLLIDVHSMPPLKPRPGRQPADIVIGDRHGRTAARRFVQTAIEVCRSYGFAIAHNYQAHSNAGPRSLAHLVSVPGGDKLVTVEAASASIRVTSRWLEVGSAARPVACCSSST